MTRKYIPTVVTQHERDKSNDFTRPSHTGVAAEPPDPPVLTSLPAAAAAAAGGGAGASVPLRRRRRELLAAAPVDRWASLMALTRMAGRGRRWAGGRGRSVTRTCWPRRRAAGPPRPAPPPQSPQSPRRPDVGGRSSPTTAGRAECRPSPAAGAVTWSVTCPLQRLQSDQ